MNRTCQWGQILVAGIERSGPTVRTPYLVEYQEVIEVNFVSIGDSQPVTTAVVLLGILKYAGAT